MPTGTAQAAEPNLMIIGHRGNMVGGNENTIQAMRLAIEAGADGLETDIRITKPTSRHPYGVMILMHDDNLGRTTNCTGKIAEKSYDWINSNCRTDKGSRIPRLDQLLDYAASLDSDPTLHLEPKPVWSQANITRLVRLLNTYPGLNDVTISAIPSAVANLDKVANANRLVAHPVKLAYGEYAPPLLTAARVCSKYDGYHQRLAYATAAYVKALQGCQPSTEVKIGGLVDEADYEEALDLGADAICADNPRRARAWLNNR